ncbi:hypothetical protein NLJ89_g8478 [Agrocybe chaxingu]|uniref:Glycoside hydrolase family 79 protein n=1 Tax=Agrocybe chaxingu TaxID=84603 RepID=A0A9W8JV95_9AGAR|nr:hypothetical protein NLJ89_g8478 [Agrocybe chaxingu]
MIFPTCLGTALALGILLLSHLQPCLAVTIYYVNGQTPLNAATTTSAGAAYTGLSAYDPTTLQAPAPPGPSVVPTSFALQLTNAVPNGASITQNGSFFGFSIEMSVVNQVLGKNASVLQVPFLNLMANLQSRGGQVHIRVGGNTQETAVLVPNTPDGRILEKDYSGITNPTQTPPLIYTPELLYMLSNISSLVNIKWHLGIPFFNTTPFNLAIAEQGQQILGGKLIGLQAANEPDLYAAHFHRNMTYGPFDYFGEFAILIDTVNADSDIPIKNLLIGPSVSTTWTPEEVWNTGFIDAYSANLAFLSVERYPTDNCGAKFPNSGIAVVNASDVFPGFLVHDSALNLVSSYINSCQIAQQKGKPLLMFETNTASCGGFPGLSDAFGAALWGIDYAMQMAAVGFSGALFHVGGQSVSYNPFTPPPTNQSTYNQWTVGPIYYSALVVTEALGATNTSRVMDLLANGNNTYTPSYGIWENGNLARVLLINFVSDSTGASDISVDLGLSDAQDPAC